DGVDEGDELRVQRFIVRVEHASEREGDVLGGHRAAVVEHRTVAQGDLVGGVVDLLRIVRGQRVVGLHAGRVEFGQAFHGVPVRGDSQGRAGGHRVVSGGAELVADGAVDGAVLVRLLIAAAGVLTGRVGATGV